MNRCTRTVACLYDRRANGRFDVNHSEECEMYDVRVQVFPTLGPLGHLSQIFAGLYDLQRERKVRLGFAQASPSLPQDILTLKNRQRVLWCTVRNTEDPHGSRPRTVIFDMRDCGHILTDSLRRSDVYFKRSYSDAMLAELNLTQSDRRKLRRYGLKYACRSESQLSHLPNLLSTLGHLRAYRAANGRPFGVGLAKDFAKIAFKSCNAQQQFEVSTEQPAEPLVLFQTRVYDPARYGEKRSRALDIDALNVLRVETVRALKHHFGDQFIGGLKRSAFAERHWPDCISRFKTAQSKYIELVSKCLVTVTTAGLAGSNGFKLPEYIAASRCIVTEAVKYEPATPLKEGENVLSFSTAQECVAACETLLANPALAAEMRRQNAHYYHTALRPSALVSRCLSEAFASQE